MIYGRLNFHRQTQLSHRLIDGPKSVATHLELGKRRKLLGCWVVVGDPTCLGVQGGAPAR